MSVIEQNLISTFNLPFDPNIGELFTLCASGDENEFKLRFTEQLLNTTNVDGQTLLHVAAHYRRYNIVKLLCQYKPDKNAQDTHGKTPLATCLQTLKHLHGSDSKKEILRDLITAENLKMYDDAGNTPLHIFLKNQDIFNKNDLSKITAIFQQLLTKESMNSVNSANKIPFQLLIKNHFFLTKVCSLKEKHDFYQLFKDSICTFEPKGHGSPLHDACTNIKDHLSASFEILSFILEIAPVMKEYTDEEGNTPLHLLLQRELPTDPSLIPLVKKLHEPKKMNRITNKEGNTLLHLVLKNSSITENPKVALQLIDLFSTDSETLTLQNSFGNTPLHELLAECRNPTHIQQLLPKLLHKESLIAANKKGMTPLHLATQNPALINDPIIGPQIFELLFQEEPSLKKVRNNQGNTPLDLALLGDYKESGTAVKIINILLHGDIGPNADGNTSLHLWLINAFLYKWQNSHIEEILLKLATPELLNVKNKRMQTPLAVAMHNSEIVSNDARKKIILPRLITKDNINEQDEGGCTVLHEAAMLPFDSAWKLPLFRFLLENNASKLIKDSQGCTPLHCLILKRGEHYYDAFDALFDAKIVDVQDEEGCTPLHLFVQSKLFRDVPVLKHADFLSLLVTNQNKNMQNKKGNTPLHELILNEQRTLASKKSEFILTTQLIKGLLSADNSKLQNTKGESPLHLAYSATSASIQMLASAETIHLQDNLGQTIFHKVVMLARDFTKLNFLLAYKPNLNQIDKEGNTPLHLAAQTVNFAAIDWLLSQKETDPNIQSKETLDTPLHLLLYLDVKFLTPPQIMNRYGAIVALLKDKRTKTDIKNNEGKTAAEVMKEENLSWENNQLKFGGEIVSS